MNTDSIISIIFAVLLFIIALCFRKGKLLFLLAGYNTLSKDEKRAKDKIKIGKFYSIIVFGAATICFVHMLECLFNLSSWIFPVVTLVIIISTIIYLVAKK